MMKTLRLSILALTAAAATSFGQQWEFGGMGGVGFLNTVGVTGTAGTATAGFQPGAAFGGYVGYNTYKHIGGELHYAYLQSNLKLSSGGSAASFSGMSQVAHYDVTFHTNASESKAQFFAAVGGGVKLFRGTGAEAAFQPLSQFGYFTKTQVLKPMGTVAVGAKFMLSRRVFLRAEIRDYVTAFPKEIITPAPGTKYGTLLHDFVPMIGLGIVM
jgi:hypothetical protein